MSLFGSLMRDMERDPIFGAHQRAMNRMMSSFFGGPAPGAGFGLSLMGPPPMGHPHHHHQHQHQHHHHPQQEHDDLMPFGMGGGMMNPFGAFGGFPVPDMSRMVPMDPTGGHHAFSSSSFVSISSGPDGRPQVYQASAETRQGPDGLKETRKTQQDSRSGTKKMAVGRHLGEKGHVVEREQNLRTGQMNENHEFYNLQEQEAPHFDREWKQRAHHGSRGQYAHSSSMPAIASSAHASMPTGAGSSRAHSYIEQAPEVEEEEDEDQYNGYHHQPPQHSQSAVTIEELPASDDEAEQMQQQSRSSRRTHANYSASSVQPPAASSSARRSPYGTSKEKRQKRGKAGKKY